MGFTVLGLVAVLDVCYLLWRCDFVLICGFGC